MHKKSLFQLLLPEKRLSWFTIKKYSGKGKLINANNLNYTAFSVLLFVHISLVKVDFFGRRSSGLEVLTDGQTSASLGLNKLLQAEG